MLVYIWFRFELPFAIGAVIALIHDVLLSLGIFAALGLEFNLPIVAAILLIVGYSMNDTVVVYDRVRENLRKYKTPAAAGAAQPQRPTRPCRAPSSPRRRRCWRCSRLLIFGGAVIRDFSFAMIWGVIVGTYSSVFIAGALLLYVQPQRGGQKRTVGQAERTAAIDAEPEAEALPAEAAPALPEPEASIAETVAAAEAAEAAGVAPEEAGRGRAPERLPSPAPRKLRPGAQAPAPAPQALSPALGPWTSRRSFPKAGRSSRATATRALGSTASATQARCWSGPSGWCRGRSRASRTPPPRPSSPWLAAEPRIDILLFGSGATFALAPAPLRTALGARGIATESMDTGAACRTYNVLMAEDRRVAAALLPASPG